MSKESYPLPTLTDITRGLLIVNRILLRRAFERLKSRRDSKYFKNIIIKNIEWGEITPIPKNFPDEFRALFPYDFTVEYTTLGCNMLKCYKHDYKKPCRGNFIINKNIPVCSEACRGVYEEFNAYLGEQFKLNHLPKSNSHNELFFETFSIEKHHNNGSGSERCYCGMQLTDLKRFGILPSSRWIPNEKGNSNVDEIEDDSPSSTFLTKRKYWQIHRDNPLQVCDMAGLVDSPPLTWDINDQNLKFNPKYCTRFRKYYDPEVDRCLKPVHRKVLGFVFGNNVTNQFSDSDLLNISTMPTSYIIESTMTANKIPELNPGYKERLVSQKKIERGFFTKIPDKVIKRREMVNIIKPQNERDIEGLMVGHYKDEISIKVGSEIGLSVLKILLVIGEDVLIEEGIESSPAISTFLLKYYSKKFILDTTKNIIMIGRGVKGLIDSGLQLATIILRAIISEVWIQIAIRSLTMLSSATTVIGTIGILTIIPEILLSKYNVGGYNREITREHIESQRRRLIEETIKQISSSNSKINTNNDFLSPLSYISISTDNDSQDKEKSLDILSPLITPEFIYNLCIINFHNLYPENINDIGRTGLDPQEEYILIQQYLSFLKINSIGQYIFIHDNNDLSIINTMENIMMENKKNKNDDNVEAESILENSTDMVKREIDKVMYDFKSVDFNSTLVGKNYDLYILMACILLGIITCFLLYGFLCQYCQFFHRKNINSIMVGVVLILFGGCFWIWKYIIKRAIF